MNTLTADWQRQLAEAFSSIDALCQYLDLDSADLPVLPQLKAFPLRVPRGFADCMEKGNPHDPLLRQVLPLQDELLDVPGYNRDPVGDLNAVAAAGVIHKYHGRVLMIATGGCAVHCRYCFRRNFPYSEQQLSTQKLEQAIDYIARRTEISEVILSGGDPLLLSDDKLAVLIRKLEAIEHVSRIRIHSRIPVVLPARISPGLLNTLAKTRQQIVLVLHANHANELSDRVAEACLHLKRRGVTLLNQSVLLKQVNDNSSALIGLSEKLFSLGVLPYYLHLLDHATGAGHFEVLEQQAKSLHQTLQQQLPGYLVPKLVKEQSGALNKIALS